MSETEKLFLQEMRKTMMRILIPVVVAIILGAGSFAVAAPFRVRAVEQKVKAIEDSYVSMDMMALYLNELRRSNTLLRTALENHNELDMAEFTRINARMDNLIREMVPHNTRGGIPEL